jgi:hypothetical protein
MKDYTILIIAVFGLIALIGVFCRMEKGFGPYNLRAVGIVVVGSFSALLAASDGGSSLTAAMGILGAIAGYLFGIKDPK